MNPESALMPEWVTRKPLGTSRWKLSPIGLTERIVVNVDACIRKSAARRIIFRFPFSSAAWPAITMSVRPERKEFGRN